MWNSGVGFSEGKEDRSPFRHIQVNCMNYEVEAPYLGIAKMSNE